MGDCTEAAAASAGGLRERVHAVIALRRFAEGDGHWYGRTALGDLLGADESLADPRVLYGRHDRLLGHKEALFTVCRSRSRFGQPSRIDCRR
jgi:hypothetical protein